MSDAPGYIHGTSINNNPNHHQYNRGVAGGVGGGTTNRVNGGAGGGNYRQQQQQQPPPPPQPYRSGYELIPATGSGTTLYDDGGRRDGIGGGRKPTQNINTMNCDPITNNTTNKYKHYHTNSNTIVTALKRETKNGYQSMMGQLRISDMYDDYGCNGNNAGGATINGLTVGLSPPNESLLMQRRLSLKSRSICNPSTDSIQQQRYNHPSPQQQQQQHQLQYRYNNYQQQQQQPHQRQTPNNIITTKSG